MKPSEFDKSMISLMDSPTDDGDREGEGEGEGEGSPTRRGTEGTAKSLRFSGQDDEMSATA
eukprot:CAMPEP_0205935220 /NCGR_PEP_ID=MMETSP1325-20131115/38471_1 /ASSEMBLY_ACC=CAM_ASM_000708 /TAXON_ID=236786 /ORGANISM="Florenciella sp., Strain RCC1007" /LENGTH=60 /DNA_ID=CAMNT_0053305289 /DNA_START=49 /DNA_END=228 /DNA_ORIENTATION=-